MRTVIEEVERLRIEDGDVLVFRRLFESYDEMDGLMEWLRSHDKPNTVVITLAPDQELSKLSESDMLRVGWVRAPRGNVG